LGLKDKGMKNAYCKLIYTEIFNPRLEVQPISKECCMVRAFTGTKEVNNNCKKLVTEYFKDADNLFTIKDEDMGTDVNKDDLIKF